MRSIHTHRKFLSPVDSAWLRMEHPTNLMMITGVFLFDELLDFARLKSTIASRLLHHRRFTQRVIDPSPFGVRPYWEKDPTFDLEAHVHRIALPGPGDQSALQNLVNDFMSSPLDLTKSPWQLHLVENYGRGCALLCRLHHCIADGIALMRVLLNMTDTEPDPTLDDTGAPSETRRQTDAPEKKSLRKTRLLGGRSGQQQRSFTHDLFGYLGQDLDLDKQLRAGVDSSAALARLLFLGPDNETPLKGPLGVRKVCAWSNPLSLAHVKGVGKVIGGTVNDVLVTAVAGALGRYLRGKGKPVSGLDIRAIIPVNLRDPDEELKLGNAFGLVFLSLPVGIDDPLERLQELKQRMDSIKATPEAVVAFGILTAMGLSPGKVEDTIVSIFEKKATVVLTNVPGPQEIRYFAGKPIRGFMFWVPQSGRLGLGISILSYAGDVMVGIAADAGLVSDPELLVSSFHREFDALFSLVKETNKTATKS